MREPSNQQVTLVAMLLTTLMAITAMLCISSDASAQDLKVPARFQPLEEEPTFRQLYYYNRAARKAVRQDWVNKDEVVDTRDSLQRLEAIKWTAIAREQNTTRFYYDGQVTTVETIGNSVFIYSRNY